MLAVLRSWEAFAVLRCVARKKINAVRAVGKLWINTA